jgi:hypothetical protein
MRTRHVVRPLGKFFATLDPKDAPHHPNHGGFESRFADLSRVNDSLIAKKVAHARIAATVLSPKRERAHVPKKWIPVFRKGHAQTKTPERIPIQFNRDAL